MPGGFSSFNFSSGPAFPFPSGSVPGGFKPSDPIHIFSQFFGAQTPFSPFGGMGGPPGMPMGPPSFMDVDDAPGSPFGGSAFGSRPGSQRKRANSFTGAGTSNDPGEKEKTGEIIKPLKLSLEDLYTGTTKKLKLTRKLLDGRSEEKVVEINAKAGWKEGTRIKFAAAGNEREDGGTPSDVVFVVEEKPHPKFKRVGDDLETTVSIPLSQAFTNEVPERVQTLDGKRVLIPGTGNKSIIQPGSRRRIVGEGWPTRKEGRAVGKGDLVVNFSITLPENLSQTQRQSIQRILAEAEARPHKQPI